MREAIGGTWIFGIVIFFIVLFSGYLAVSVNYSKAFKVKNVMINIIEKNRGYNNQAEQEILEYMQEVGYFATGNCSGEASKGGDVVGGKSRYCVAKQSDSSDKSTFPKTYYTVTVFFKIDLPIFGNLFVFPVYGQTKSIIQNGKYY